MGIKLLFTKASTIISHVMWIMLSNLPIEMCLHKFFKVYLDYKCVRLQFAWSSKKKMEKKKTPIQMERNDQNKSS